MYLESNMKNKYVAYYRGINSTKYFNSILYVRDRDK